LPYIPKKIENFTPHKFFYATPPPPLKFEIFVPHKFFSLFPDDFLLQIDQNFLILAKLRKVTEFYTLTPFEKMDERLCKKKARGLNRLTIASVFDFYSEFCTCYEGKEMNE